jgi:hypothetical protein
MAKLWEALKSGKRFRSPDYPKGTWENPNDFVGDGNILELTAHDLKSNEWEIEEDPKSRRVAWINLNGTLRYATEKEIDGYMLKASGWTRAHWLPDEPESKQCETDIPPEGYEPNWRTSKK